VANHLALFKKIIASTAKRPIEAATKHIALKKHFSSQSFSYAGNSRDDISIWNIAASAVIVDAPESVQAQVVKNSTVEKIFKSPQKPVTETILQEIRIHHSVGLWEVGINPEKHYQKMRSRYSLKWRSKKNMVVSRL
jgi:hypothetical protein